MNNRECQWQGCGNPATTLCSGPLPGEKNWACDEHKCGCGVVPMEDLSLQNNGYFEAMRRAHPMKLGDIVEGKRVVKTFWEWSPENGNVPMYQLEGEANCRVVIKP